MLSKNVICSIVSNVIVKVTLYISGCFTQISVTLKSVYKCDHLCEIQAKVSISNYKITSIKV